MMRSITLTLLFTSFLSCSEDENGSRVTEQYAMAVEGFSSEYNASPEAWSAQQTLGQPDVYPAYGDIGEAWASKTEDSEREFLVLTFDNPQKATEIEVYETFNPGAVDTLYLRKASDKSWVMIWSGSADNNLPPASRIFSVSFPETSFETDAIRVAINSPSVPGWNEIDAVRIRLSN